MHFVSRRAEIQILECSNSKPWQSTILEISLSTSAKIRIFEGGSPFPLSRPLWYCAVICCLGTDLADKATVQHPLIQPLFTWLPLTSCLRLPGRPYPKQPQGFSKTSGLSLSQQKHQTHSYEYEPSWNVCGLFLILICRITCSKRDFRHPPGVEPILEGGAYIARGEEMWLWADFLG